MSWLKMLKMRLNQSSPMLVTCIVIPAAAALATALSASFSTHASTVCMGVSLTGLSGIQMGCILSPSLPKHTLGNQGCGLYTLENVET